MSARRLLAAWCCALAFAACTGPSAEAQAGVQPPGAPPGEVPPPPPGAPLPDGQWVYTQQYGWVWMPFEDQFTFVPPGGAGEPLQYVFYGGYGWTWVAAPWVWGYGPGPRWGRPGPNRYAWYRNGWWRTPQRWRYTAPPARGPIARPGIRPPPPGSRAPIAPPVRPPTAAQPQPQPAHRGAGGEHDGGGFVPGGAQR
jgi:hypothetical protein